MKKKIGTKNINNFNIIHVGVSRSWGYITRFLNKHKRATGILILESVTSESLSIFERNMQVLVVVTRIHSWTRWSREQKSHCCVFIVHLGNKISYNEKWHHFIDYKIITLKKRPNTNEPISRKKLVISAFLAFQEGVEVLSRLYRTS